MGSGLQDSFHGRPEQAQPANRGPGPGKPGNAMGLWYSYHWRVLRIGVKKGAAMTTDKTPVALLAAFATASAGQAPTEERLSRRFPRTCPR